MAKRSQDYQRLSTRVDYMEAVRGLKQSLAVQSIELEKLSKIDGLRRIDQGRWGRCHEKMQSHSMACERALHEMRSNQLTSIIEVMKHIDVRLMLEDLGFVSGYEYGTTHKAITKFAIADSSSARLLVKRAVYRLIAVMEEVKALPAPEVSVAA